MSEAEKVQEAVVALSALAETQRSAGWPLVCAKIDAEIKHIEERIFDPKTSDADVAVLRRVRTFVMELSPGNVMSALQAKHKASANRR